MGSRFGHHDDGKARYLAAAVCVAAAITIGMWPWQLSRSFAETQIAAMLRGLPGEPRLRGFQSATFAALPWPSIRVHGLDIALSDGPVEKLAAARLDARLGLHDWAGGAARVVSVAALGAHATLSADQPDSSGQAARSATQLINDWALRAADVPEVRIDHGAIHDATGTRAEGIALRLMRQGFGERSIRVAAQIEGETYRFSATRGAGGATNPRALAWSATGAGIEASFDGVLMQADALDARGRFALRSSPSPFMRRWSASVASVSEAVGTLSVDGEATFAWPSLVLKEARIKRGEEQSSGSLEITMRERAPAVTAILHTPSIDLTHAFTGLSAMLQEEARPTSDRASGVAGPMRLDLRLSADQVHAHGLTIRGAALTASLGDERAEFTINEAQFAGGFIKSRLFGSLSPRGREWRLNASVDRLDLSALPTSISLRKNAGRVTGHLAIEAAGRSQAEMARSARGRAALSIRDGEFPGFDLDKAGALAAAPGARTRFSQLATQLQIEDGVARLLEGSLTTPQNRFNGSGRIALETGAVQIELTPAPPADPRGQQATSGLRLEGENGRLRVSPLIAPSAPRT
jgi:hypothetical protein